MRVRKGLCISFGRSCQLGRIFAGSILTVAVSMSLVLSQRVFANRSDTSHPIAAAYLSESKSLMAEEPAAVDADKNHDNSWQVVRMRVTAYCPCSKCCGKYSDGITACNHRIQGGDRFVAADRSYPFGTPMIIPGYNKSEPVEVKDRGGAIKNDKLDVFFNTHEEALEWGVQYLDVLVKVR
jgi:3D (Asp-Asp-Asp) domain-containing protein